MQLPPPSFRTDLARFTVAFEYPVHFTTRALDPNNPVLIDSLRRREPNRRHRVLAFLDAGVRQAWPQIDEQLRQYATAHASSCQLVDDPVIIPGGESAKNDPNLVQQVLQCISQQHIDRQSYCLIIGGGAVQDAVGLAAAVAHRGVRVVRMPTTVLSQNDSGVGVKNGINAFGAKNFVGSFAPPFAVVNDADFLETLEPRDRLSGIAEAVKVALIRDGEFFEWLWDQVDALRAFDSTATQVMIRRTAQLHLNHITTGGDPFEWGSARPLDFGHWAAHRLENLTQHALRHGEAVAIGIALDSCYSAQAGLLAVSDAERVCTLLRSLGFTLYHPLLHAKDEQGELLLWSGLSEFREHLGGELTVTLLDALGNGVERNYIDRAILMRSITWLREIHGSGALLR